MSIASVVVVFAVTWFLVFFCVLPLRFVSQGDAGSIVPGTPAGAPADFVVGRKARITTVVTALLTLAICAFVSYSGLTIGDLDWMHTAVPLQR